MITETFTIKEMEAEISKNYSAIMGALLKYAPQYKKDFTKRRHVFDYPMVYTTTKKVVIKGNTYIGVFGSNTPDPKDFGVQCYLQLETSQGRRYYRIIVGGIVLAISKHFIERFIERSPYPCTKDNFLVYMSKELHTYMRMDIREDRVSYGASVNGLVVIKGNTYITYMTDLTQLKQKLMEEVMAEVATIPHKRQESIRAQIKALLNS